MKLLAAPLLLVASSAFVLADVVINEIHYDPEPKTELVEFVELLNNGDQSVSLDGWSFTSGFAYTFPADASLAAGEYLILTENVSDYNRKFGSIFVGGKKAFGEFESGTLSNEGDRVVLRDAGQSVAVQRNANTDSVPHSAVDAVVRERVLVVSLVSP